MAGLLVSVRSAAEARAALAGGATVIDVKEPAHGPLGRAEPAVWREVVRAVAGTAPVSVALGELPERAIEIIPPDAWTDISFRKVGLGSAPPSWAEDLRRMTSQSPQPAWIAVAYADWCAAGAPEPDAVLDAALRLGCRGILVDTWNKSSPTTVDVSWRSWVRRAQAGGMVVTIAGGLDESAIRALLPLQPDLFAVRGAACDGGRRLGSVSAERVATLRRAISVGDCAIP